MKQGDGIGRAFFRSVFFIPTAISYVIASLIWRMSIFSGLPYGVANQVLWLFKIQSIPWIGLAQPPVYWLVLVTVRLWLQLGFQMILLLAAMQDIPQELYEAARVDGAESKWLLFRNITLPMIRNTSVFLIIMNIIHAFNAFAEFFNILGGTMSTAEMLSLARPPLVWLYQVAMNEQRFGVASAGGVIVGLMIIVFTIIQTKLSGGLGREIWAMRELEGIATHTLLVVLALLFLFPFYILVRNALMTDPQMTGFDWLWFPPEPQWRNFVDLFADKLVPMANSFKNSAMIAVSIAVCEVLIAIMAGYALARIPHPSRNLIFGLLLSTLLIPGTGTLIPKYVMVAKMGMVNTPQGLVVPQMFSVFSAFMFRQYFLSFPRDLEDAGHVDGLGYWGVFWRIAFPNAWPVITALGSLALINGWNDFLWPLLIGQKRTWWTVQIALSTYITAQVVVLRLAFAGALLGALPMLIMFLFLQRRIAQGYTRSGIKG